MRFVLDVELRSGAIRGQLESDGGEPVPFDGWLELVGLIEGGWDERQGTPNDDL